MTRLGMLRLRGAQSELLMVYGHIWGGKEDQPPRIQLYKQDGLTRENQGYQKRGSTIYN